MSTREPPKAKRVADLLDQEFVDVASWIEPEVLPKGGTLLFGGEAKIGKSWLMAEFAKALVTCRSPFGYHDFNVPSQARVLIIEQELGERGFQKRLRKVLANEPRRMWEDNLFYESKRPELQLSDMGRRHFVSMVKDVKPDVLILDPISMMHTFDENDATKIAELFRTLEMLKQLDGVGEMSVILSHHFGKPNTDPRMKVDLLSPYNFRGSSKWKDTPDTLCTVLRAKELDLTWEAWELHARFMTRHSSCPPDMVLSVSRRRDDGEVRFERYVQKKLPQLEEGPPLDHPLSAKTGKELDQEQTKLSFNVT